MLCAILNACATGSGTTEGSTGTACLSLQLKELVAGESYETQNGFVLEFTTFSMAFSQITVGSFGTVESFTADFADELISGEKRRMLDITMARKQSTARWGETLREYCGCYLVFRNGEYHLIPDRVEVDGLGAIIPDYAIDHTDMIEGSFKIGTKDMSKVPTYVVTSYTDISAGTYDSKDSDPAYLDDGQGNTVLNQGIPRRESKVSMPGIQRGTQAYREAEERLNYFNSTDLEMSWDAFDDMIIGEVGDDITVSHPLTGGTPKDMRIISAQALDAGRWRFKAEELQASRYSDHVGSIPDTPDTSFPNPNDPPPSVTGLSVSEQVDKIADGTFTTRLKATWTAPDYPFLQEYGVIITKVSGGALVHSTVVTDNEYLSPEVEELDANGVEIEYRISIFTISTSGLASSPTIYDHTIVGTTAKPVWPNGSTMHGFNEFSPVRTTKHISFYFPRW